jgi:uncharacterized coiled-coil protein SlyX
MRKDIYNTIMSPSDSEQHKRTKIELDYTREAAKSKINELETKLEEKDTMIEELMEEVKYTSYERDALAEKYRVLKTKVTNEGKNH